MVELRDRPFNLKGVGGLWFFVSFRIFSSDNTRVRLFIFFVEFNIRFYDKNSESDYLFFPPPKAEYFFQQHWESEYFFRKKTYPPFKLNGRSLILYISHKCFIFDGACFVSIVILCSNGILMTLPVVYVPLN